MISFALISTRREYWSLFGVYVPIAAAVFVVVVLLVVWVVLRFRRRDRPARWSENSPLEASYAVVLLLISIFLMYLTFSHEHRVDTVANRERPSLTVDVTAARVGVGVHLPALRDRAAQRRRSAAQPLVVPAGRGDPLQPDLARRDPLRSGSPSLRYKHDAIPGSTQVMTLSVHPDGRVPGPVRGVLRAASRRHGVHRARGQLRPRSRPGRGQQAARRRERHECRRTCGGAGPALGGLARRTDQHRPQADRAQPGRSARWSSSCSAGVFALLMRTQLAQPNDALRLGQLLQRAVHDARLDDDLPVRHADGDRAGDVPGAAADRRRCGSPAPRLALAGFWTWLCGGLVMQRAG